MSIVRIALIAAALATPALAANAATPRLTDSQYIAANRCVGLMESKNLGPVDDYALKARIKAESSGRQSAVWDMADQARQDAVHDAGRALGEIKAQLISERDTACQALVPATQTTSAPSASHTD